MNILIAEDNPTTQRLLESLLVKMGHHVTVVSDGEAAWNNLQRNNSDTPRMALLDWMMPRMHGPDLCRRLRAATHIEIQPYLILVTSRDGRDDLAAGLRSGADDYVAKPFDHTDLQARVRCGVRVMELHERLLEADRYLADAQQQLETLRHLLPICASCQKIRDDKQYWLDVQQHLGSIPSAWATHGVCPECWVRVEPERQRLAAEAAALAAPPREVELPADPEELPEEEGST
ncbi:MAG TPA: response regulator [Gemmatales bacterium]|nr:response regulator [Gemmatales bacterium]HMP60280.1 response regulator [Gemmatales bacterium]